MKWFKHYSDASDDLFIESLEDKFGWEGYGRWWKLLEIIARSMNNNQPIAEHSWVKWQSFLKGKRNKLELFLKHCQDKGKINLEQTGNILKITCPKLLELKDNYSKDLQVASKLLASPIKEERIRKKKEDSSVVIGENDFQKVYQFGSSIFPKLAVANNYEITKWLESGCDVEKDILPELQRKKGQQIGSWSYFTEPIAQAKANRLKPMPEHQPQQKGNHNAKHQPSNQPAKSWTEAGNNLANKLQREIDELEREIKEAANDAPNQPNLCITENLR